jgi:Xaa-Pro aminopeptidase
MIDFCPNGKVRQVTPSVVNERLERLRRLLHEEEVDILVCRLPENVVFASGYWPNTADSLFALAAKGDAALFIPVADKRYAQRSWLSEITMTTANELDRLSGWLLSGLEYLVKWATAKVPRELIIGYEGSFETAAGSHIGGEVTVPSVHWQRMLSEHFEGATLKDVTDPLRAERQIKTPEEVDRIRSANAIASAALDAVIPQVRAGLKESEVAAMIEGAVQTRGYGYEAVLRARGFGFVQSGPVNSSNGWWPFSISSERVIKDGDSVLIELDAYADGYWCDITRSFVVGRASDTQVAMRRAVVEARSSVLDRIRAGPVTCAELDAVAREFLSARFDPHCFPHKIGHGVGFAFHELPLLHPKIHDVVPVGAVLAIEPGLYVPEVGGYRLEDDVYVGPNGLEVLTTAQVPAL